MNELITIKTGQSTGELLVAKSYLEDNEIKCYLKDEYLGEMLPAVTTNRGVQLQVAQEDVESALELLISGGFASRKDYEDYSDWLTKLFDKILNVVKGK